MPEPTAAYLPTADDLLRALEAHIVYCESPVCAVCTVWWDTISIAERRAYDADVTAPEVTP